MVGFEPDEIVCLSRRTSCVGQPSPIDNVYEPDPFYARYWIFFLLSDPATLPSNHDQSRSIYTTITGNISDCATKMARNLNEETGFVEPAVFVVVVHMVNTSRLMTSIKAGYLTTLATSATCTSGVMSAYRVDGASSTFASSSRSLKATSGNLKNLRRLLLVLSGMTVRYSRAHSNKGCSAVVRDVSRWREAADCASALM